MTVTERVAQGAALLDAKKPGWAARINLRTLDLSDTCLCILGQLYGLYADATSVLFQPSETYCPAEQALLYGFDLTSDEVRNIMTLPYIEEALTRRRDYYRALQDAWVVEIAARVATLAPAEADYAEV